MSEDLRRVLEERTFCFAEAVGLSVKELMHSPTNDEYVHQLVQASSQLGVRYLEANVVQSKQNFIDVLYQCRLYAKRSSYWMRLIINTNDDSVRRTFEPLLKEAAELDKIFRTILSKFNASQQRGSR